MSYLTRYSELLSDSQLDTSSNRIQDVFNRLCDELQRREFIEAALKKQILVSFQKKVLFMNWI